jgi:hypothetical protein
MFSRRITVALAAAVLFGLFAFNACAQWTPGGMAINFGGFDLESTASAEVPGIKPYVIGNQLTDSLSSDNLTMNSSTMNNTTMESSQTIAMPIADLSNYGKDRRDGNLKGYTNIMYPLSESAGFTATAAGSGGGCGGCG